MDKPTQKQIKEFWERYGFIDIFEDDTGAYYWKAPNGDAGVDLPPIDLNNLFKYAVPKLQDKGYWIELFSFEHKGYKVKIYPVFGEVDIPIAISKDDDPALALFWALWQVKEQK